MNALSPDTRFAVDHVEVLIVGAGISGIGMAAHLEMMCPGKSYRVVERRPQLGGTWDLFRYPGIRSDSDMYTLGYNFKPWLGEKSIADGASIRSYIEETARENGIDKHIRYEHKVVSADWSTIDASYKEADELPPHHLTMLRRFFQDYKQLEGKSVEVDQFQPAEASSKVILEALERYTNKRRRGFK